LSDPADPGAPISRHAADRDDRAFRRGHPRPGRSLLDPDRKAGAGPEGRLRRRDFADLQPRLGEDRERRPLTGERPTSRAKRIRQIKPNRTKLGQIKPKKLLGVTWYHLVDSGLSMGYMRSQ